jgi:hypothetical protein
MKLAVLIAGHLRTFDWINVGSLMNFLHGYDYDLFVVTHRTLDRSEQKHYYGHDLVMSDDDIRGKFKGLPLKELKITDDADYSTRKCIKCRLNLPEWVDPNKKLDHDMGLCSTHCETCKEDGMVFVGADSYCWRMWHSISECYELCREYAANNDVIYDYYIRGRPDILYMERIDFSKLPPLNDKLIIGFGTNLGYPNDTFAIGKGEAFAAYCDIDNVVINSLYSHGIVASVLERYPMYKFFDLAWKRRNFDTNTQTWTKNEIQYYPKRLYITDPSLRDF